MEPQNTLQTPPESNNTSVTPPPDAPEPQKRKSLAWLWITLGTLVVLALIGAAVFWLGNAIFNNLEQQTNQPEIQNYTIGNQPYVYACSVAPASEYGRIFGLNATSNVGTVNEMGALPPKQAGVTETDLTKLIPSANGQFVSTCTNALPNSDGTRLKRLNVTLSQHPEGEEADSSMRGARSLASNFGKNNLPALSSFENSFVKLPVNDPLNTTKATAVIGTNLVTLEYAYDAPQTNDSTVSMLNEYMQVVEQGLVQEKITAPLNLTGHQTVTDDKFVDVCHNTDLQKVTKAFGDIQLRPDEYSTGSTYGSVEGSRAAEDGVVSNCKLTYNTASDREAQATIEQSSDVPSEETVEELTAASKWPHTLNMNVNSFASRDKARAWFDARKQQAGNPTSGIKPTVEAVSGLGDDAYKAHKEDTQDTSAFSDEATTTVYLDDSYVILSDKNVVTLTLQQVKEATDYQTAPLAPSQEQFKQVFELVGQAF